MKSIICTKDTWNTLRDKILAEFKAYCDNCVSNNLAIEYTNRISSTPEPEAPRQKKNEALFSWGNQQAYTTDNEEMANLVTTELIFPCINYVLTLKQQYQLYYRTSFGRESVERVRLTPGTITATRVQAAKAEAPAEKTSFFGSN